MGIKINGICCTRNFIINGLVNNPPYPPPDPEPTCSDYTVEWVVFNPGVFGGTALIATLNGVDLTQNTADIVSQLQAVMSNWEGKTNVQVSFNPDSSGDFFYIGLTRLTSEGAFTNFGEYINLFDPTPQTVVATDSNCFLNCYTTTFTTDGSGLAEFGGFVIEGMLFDAFGLADVLFTDPDFATLVPFYMNPEYGIIDPEFSISVQFSGPDVTVIINTLIPIDGVVWASFVGDLNHNTSNTTPC